MLHPLTKLHDHNNYNVINILFIYKYILWNIIIVLEVIVSTFSLILLKNWQKIGGVTFIYQLNKNIELINL